MKKRRRFVICRCLHRLVLFKMLVVSFEETVLVTHMRGCPCKGCNTNYHLQGDFLKRYIGQRCGKLLNPVTVSAVTFLLHSAPQSDQLMEMRRSSLNSGSDSWILAYVCKRAKNVSDHCSCPFPKFLTQGSACSTHCGSLAFQLLYLSMPSIQDVTLYNIYQSAEFGLYRLYHLWLVISHRLPSIAFEVEPNKQEHKVGGAGEQHQESLISKKCLQIPSELDSVQLY
ncbi:hypothetical protein T11_14706 [Trichinella zimbabwensis]|uniref:Uncharacterized protein n=1 Tax=Trichinella zimbabwensis TaxID=268475 RepID=A0A0V1HLH8_9BILA|nr:hypothetical protein T11_14706 [Trichinella zimbabwensis]